MGEDALAGVRESRAILKMLIRASLSKVLYVRGLLPCYHFQEQEVYGVPWPMLACQTGGLVAAEHSTLVERGLLPGLRRGLTEKVVLAVSHDPEGCDLIEAWQILVRWRVHESSARADPTARAGQGTAHADVTYACALQAAQAVLRGLCEAVQTVHQLPDARYYSIHVIARESDSLEPSAGDDLAFFGSRPETVAIGQELDTGHLQFSLFLTRPSCLVAEKPCELHGQVVDDDDWSVIYPVNWADFGGALEAGARMKSSTANESRWMGTALVHDLLGSAYRKIHEVGHDVFSGIGEELSNVTRQMGSASTDEEALPLGYSLFH
mmetsp:Transcript_51862/g.119258  ORF Transcript_51862/g.119258 Transcript_51862/m.119258 type:complete len:323 (-) Transcript_51862:51-1019(-)